jgi:hypothetical protein
MNEQILKRLDKEHYERISALASIYNGGKDILTSDIIQNRAIVASLGKPKLVLPSFRTSDIYRNYAITPRLFVQLCPECIKTEPLSNIIEVLKASDVVPILLGRYQTYPVELMKVILTRPHINRDEFQLFRGVMLMSENRWHCHHCADQARQELLTKVENGNRASMLKKIINHSVQSLHPFINSDFKID